MENLLLTTKHLNMLMNKQLKRNILDYIKHD